MVVPMARRRHQGAAEPVTGRGERGKGLIPVRRPVGADRTGHTPSGVVRPGPVGGAASRDQEAKINHRAGRPLAKDHRNPSEGCPVRIALDTFAALFTLPKALPAALADS